MTFILVLQEFEGFSFSTAITSEWRVKGRIPSNSALVSQFRKPLTALVPWSKLKDQKCKKFALPSSPLPP